MAAVCRLIGSLQDGPSAKGWCYASERALRECLAVMIGRVVGARSIGRVIHRLAKTGEIVHKRRLPGEEVRPGCGPSGSGGQHNRYVPRSLLRAEAKRKARAKKRAQILAQQRANKGLGFHDPPPALPITNEAAAAPLRFLEPDVTALLAAGEYAAANALLKSRDPPY